MDRAVECHDGKHKPEWHCRAHAAVTDGLSKLGITVGQIAKRKDCRVAGTLKSREDVVTGLENFPETLLKLFNGENFGKLVLRVAPA